MPRIVDYPTVVETARAMGMKPLYYNSGTFGFADESGVQYAGWTSGDDPTVRAELRSVARLVADPAATMMAAQVCQLWQTVGAAGGAIWFTPGNHWAYELDDGGAHYMPALLDEIGIDRGRLTGLNNGAAIEFARDEAAVFESFLRAVLEGTKFTDYGLLMPGEAVIGLIHHHRQIWWRVRDGKWLEALRTVRLGAAL